MIHVREHLNILGYKVKDRITGFTGVASSVGFDLYGCVQVIVNPGMNNEGKLGDQCWFDIARLEITSKAPVMVVPNYEYGLVAEGKKGPAEKPVSNKF